MAVTATAVRNHVFKGVNGTQEICTLTLSGTYTSGFTLNLGAISAGLGSSPYYGAAIFSIFQSPTLNDYLMTVAGNTGSIKIYTPAGTELANGAALPDATVPFILYRRLVTT